MARMDTFKCSMCGAETNGKDGCTMMITVVRRDITAMAGRVYCEECYEKYVRMPLSMLNSNGEMGMKIPEE